jgi:hypothetical protein
LEKYKLCLKCEKNKIFPLDINKIDFNEDVELEIKTLYQNEEGIDGKRRNIENEMIRDGAIQIIGMGYGSTLDTDMYLVGICDDCLKSLQKSGLVLYYGSYIFYPKSAEMIEESKRLYLRRRNLDKLV